MYGFHIYVFRLCVLSYFHTLIRKLLILLATYIVTQSFMHKTKSSDIRYYIFWGYAIWD